MLRAERSLVPTCFDGERGSSRECSQHVCGRVCALGSIICSRFAVRSTLHLRMYQRLLPGRESPVPFVLKQSIAEVQRIMARSDVICIEWRSRLPRVDYDAEPPVWLWHVLVPAWSSHSLNGPTTVSDHVIILSVSFVPGILSLFPDLGYLACVPKALLQCYGHICGRSRRCRDLR